MFDDVLVPTDGSPNVADATRHALGIAERFDATITALFVADTNRDSVTVVGRDVVDALEAEGEDIVGEVAEQARARGVDCETEIHQGDPAETIVDFAEERGQDLIVLPTRGRGGFHRYLMGSVTEKVVQLSSVPVLTLRTGEDARETFPYENVLVATDGSAAADTAADRAIDLAGALDAALHVISVTEDAPLGTDVRSGSPSEEFETEAHEAVAETTSVAEKRGVDVVDSVREGSAYEQIRAYVDENDVDLIVLGTTGKRGLDEILLGGVTEKLVRSSPVPVLTIRK